MANTKEGLNLLEKSIEKGLEDLRGQIQDLQEGMQGSLVPMVLHEEFTTILNMLANLGSRVEALTRQVEAWDEKVRPELAIFKVMVLARVMATFEVLKPQVFNRNRDAKELDNFLWMMERYFEAINLWDEAAKVRTAIRLHYGGKEGLLTWKRACAA